LFRVDELHVTTIARFRASLMARLSAAWVSPCAPTEKHINYSYSLSIFSERLDPRCRRESASR
jgi:hypothetical protein